MHEKFVTIHDNCETNIFKNDVVPAVLSHVPVLQGDFCDPHGVLIQFKVIGSYI